jgi:hypothetical protein
MLDRSDSKRFFAQIGAQSGNALDGICNNNRIGAQRAALQ